MHTVPMLIVWYIKKTVLIAILLILWIGGCFGAFSDLSTTHDTTKNQAYSFYSVAVIITTSMKLLLKIQFCEVN